MIGMVYSLETCLVEPILVHLDLETTSMEKKVVRSWAKKFLEAVLPLLDQAMWQEMTADLADWSVDLVDSLNEGYPSTLGYLYEG